MRGAEEYPEVDVPEGYEPPDASLPYAVNEAPKNVQGLLIDIPGKHLTLFDLGYAVERLRINDVPSDARLKIWFDPECRRDGEPIGPATRIMASWLT